MRLGKVKQFLAVTLCAAMLLGDGSVSTLAGTAESEGTQQDTGETESPVTEAGITTEAAGDGGQGTEEQELVVTEVSTESEEDTGAGQTEEETEVINAGIGKEEKTDSMEISTDEELSDGSHKEEEDDKETEETDIVEADSMEVLAEAVNGAAEELAPAYQFTVNRAKAVVDGSRVEMEDACKKTEDTYKVSSEVFEGDPLIDQELLEKDSVKLEKIAESSDYTVEEDGKNINLVSPYDSKCLIVKDAGDGFDTFGAQTLIRGYDGLSILFYDTAENTKNAYLAMQEAGLTVETDSVLDTETVTSLFDKEADSEVGISDFVNGSRTKDNEKETNSADDAQKTKEEDAANHADVPEGSKVTVAVLDTGYDFAGSSNERILDGLDLSGSGTAQDENGHGTAMADIIKSGTDDPVSILPIRITDVNGRCTSLKLYLGLEYALAEGVDVVNVSMSAYRPADGSMIAEEIAKLAQNGIYVVTAAGNHGSDTRDYVPANVSNAIVVSAIEADDTASGYSNHGDTVDYSAYGSVTAHVLNGEEKAVSGTSVSSAIVSAVIAGKKSLTSGISYEDMFNCLDEEAKDLGEAGKDSVFGTGALYPDMIDSIQDQENPWEGIDCELFTCDWKNLSDEELDKIMEETDEDKMYLFLKGLTGSETEELLSRDTAFSRPVAVMDNITEDVSTCSIKSYDRYYDYLTENEYSVAWSTSKASQTGYFKIQQNSGTAYKVTVKYTGLSTTDANPKPGCSMVWATDGKTNAVGNYRPDGGDIMFQSASVGTGAGDVNNIYLNMNLKVRNLDRHSYVKAGKVTGLGDLGGGFTDGFTDCTGSSTSKGNIGLMLALNSTGIKLTDHNTTGNATVQLKTGANSTKKGSWSIPTVVTDPTCTAEGKTEQTREITCNSCGKKVSTEKKTGTLSALGHAWGTEYIGIAETCTADGANYHQCRRCGAIERTSIRPALGHAWGAEYVGVAETCTTDGANYHQCGRCGAIEKSSIRPQLGHLYPDSYQYANDSGVAKGLRYKNCRRCNTRLETYYYREIQAREQNADGNYGSYETVAGGSLYTDNTGENGYYLANSTAPSWSKAADAAYQAVSTVGGGTVNNASVIKVDVKRNIHTITYRSNTPDTVNLPSTQTARYGETITLSDKVPSAPQKVFVEWNTNSDGKSGDSYNAGSKVTVNSDVILYPDFDDEIIDYNIFDITLNPVGPDAVLNETVTPTSNGGAGTYYKRDDKDGFYPGGNKNLEIVSPVTSVVIPKKDNYTFEGWYYNDTLMIDSTGNLTDAGKAKGTENQTWVAHYTRNTFVATLDNGGATEPGTEAVYEKCGTDDFYDNSKMENEIAKITVPERNLDFFLGYYDADGNRVIDEQGNIICDRVMTGDETWVAKWDTKINIVYIGEGKDTGENHMDIDVELGSDYSMNSNLDASGREIFQRSFEEQIYSGKTLESSVVGWYLKKVDTAGNVNDGTLDADFIKNTSETVSMSELLQLAINAGAVTYGAPAEGYYAEGESIPEAADKESALRRYINLYPVWDDGPEVAADDLYVSLKYAQDGVLTKDWLLKYVKARDVEAADAEHPDGYVDGTDAGTELTFDIVGYTDEDFTRMTGDAYHSIMYRVTDKAGNTTNKRVIVYVYDTTGIVLPNIHRAVRAVSRKYYRFTNKNPDGSFIEGGIDTFEDDSKWVTDPDCIALLTRTLNNEREDQIVRSFHGLVNVTVAGSGHWKYTPMFTILMTHEDVLWSHEYVDQHGIGNSMEPDALTGYLQYFKDQNKFRYNETYYSNVNADEDGNLIREGWQDGEPLPAQTDIEYDENGRVIHPDWIFE